MGIVSLQGSYPVARHTSQKNGRVGAAFQRFFIDGGIVVWLAGIDRPVDDPAVLNQNIKGPRVPLLRIYSSATSSRRRLGRRSPTPRLDVRMNSTTYCTSSHWRVGSRSICASARLVLEWRR